MSSPASLVLRVGIGASGAILRWYAYGLGANIVLNLLLIPAFGILGAAIATCTAMLGANLWLHRQIELRLGVNASVVSVFAKRDR